MRVKSRAMTIKCLFLKDEALRGEAHRSNLLKNKYLTSNPLFCNILQFSLTFFANRLILKGRNAAIVYHLTPYFSKI